jgi:hypothetical protein
MSGKGKVTLVRTSKACGRGGSVESKFHTSATSAVDGGFVYRRFQTLPFTVGTHGLRAWVVSEQVRMLQTGNKSFLPGFEPLFLLFPLAISRINISIEMRGE